MDQLLLAPEQVFLCYDARLENQYHVTVRRIEFTVGDLLVFLTDFQPVLVVQVPFLQYYFSVSPPGHGRAKGKRLELNVFLAVNGNYAVLRKSKFEPVLFVETTAPHFKPTIFASADFSLKS